MRGLEARTNRLFDGEPPRRGISDLVALALVVMKLDVVQRSTVRALCPPGETRKKRRGGSVNIVSDAFLVALRRFDAQGWISRRGGLIVVIDRAALMTWVDSAEDATPERAATMLRVAEAAEAINAQPLPDLPPAALADLLAVRERELGSLKRLMESPPGQPDTKGQHGTRVVPRSRPL